MGVLLMADGMPMTFDKAAEVATLEPGAMGTDAKGQSCRSSLPVVLAAIIPIKHLGTNGGGFSAPTPHPFEIPAAWSNFLECQHSHFPVLS